MRKVDHRGRRKSRSSTFSADSGYADSSYADSGYASYPTLSRTTSSSAPSWQASTATLTPSIQSAAPSVVPSVPSSVRSRPSSEAQRRASTPFLSPHSYSKHEKWKPLPPVPQQAADDAEMFLHGHAVPTPTPTQTSLGELPQVPVHPPGSECSWAKRVEGVARIGVVGKCSECGASMLHSVAAGGGLLVQENFRRLVNKYKDSIKSRDIFGNTPLHAAAAAGLGANEFQILHDAGADLLASNDKGETFLHLLTTDHKKDSSIMILEWATDQKIDFKLSTIDGKTILHSICERNVSLWTLPKMWYFLRTLGTDINLRDRWGKTAMDYLKASLALQGTDRDMPTLGPQEVDRLLENYLPRYKDHHDGEDPRDDVEAALSAKVNSLETFALSDNAMFDVVLRSEQDPAAQDCDGKNALHCLAHILRFPGFEGRVQPPTFRQHLVEWICVHSKVNANAYDGCGSTPLHSFLTYPRANDDEKVLADIVQFLLEHDADPNMRDRAGNTALHLACFHGHFLCMKVLRGFLQKDATMYKNATRARNDRGQSPVTATLSSMNTGAWSPDEKQIRQKCLELVTHSEFTEDDSEQSRFWGIPNSISNPIPKLTVSPVSITRPPSPMDES
jgi:ankyrin repeat protein